MTSKAHRRSNRKPRLILRAKSRRVGRKKAPRRGVQKRRRGAESAATGGFPRIGGKEGCSAVLVVAERVGRHLDRVTNSLELFTLGTDGAGKVPRGRKGGRRRSKQGVEIPPRVCEAMFALGHVQRMRVIRKLLDGPATYQALKRITKLKPGPLYHHVNQLRLAGLILPKQRDLYELTRAGRNLVLGMMVLAPLARDLRHRPTA